MAFILPHFFASVFYIDFSLIFSRFRKGFGKDLGGQNGRKIEILTVFGNMLFETLILVEFCLSFDKIEGEKNAVFLVVFCVIFGVFSNARNLKNRAPVEARAQFLQNCIFRARGKKTPKLD